MALPLHVITCTCMCSAQSCGKQLCVQSERKMARVPISKMHVKCKVLARPSPKGTVPLGGGGSNMPFGPATKETMCPLAPPQNQHIFNSHLNYLNLKLSGL